MGSYWGYELISLAPYHVTLDKFAATIENADLLPIDTKGSIFTWARRGALSFFEGKLDRFFDSSTCLDFWNVVSCTAFLEHQLDHNALFLSFTKDLGLGRRLFRFQTM